MLVTYDKEADAVYIYLAPESAKSAETVGDWPYHIDLDEKGQPIGIEVMDASSIFSQEYLDKNTERIDRNG